MGSLPALPLFTSGPARSATLNRLRDISAILLNPPRCRAYLTTDTSIPGAATTYISLTGEVYDVVLSGDTPAHDTATNSTRIYARVAGYYRVTAQVTYKASATLQGNRSVVLRKNGTDLLAEAYTAASTTASSSAQIQGAEFLLAAGDYVEMGAYQSSGAALDIWGTSSLTFLQVTFVGASATTSGEEATDIASLHAESSLGTADLDAVKAPGNYVQGTAADASLARHYPVATVTGHLQVFSDGTASPTLIAQHFTVSSTNALYVRTYSAAAWSAWSLK